MCNGRGPGESYRDIKQANRFGIYDGLVSELGLFTLDRPSFNFSAHHYSTQNMDEAQHRYELIAEDKIHLHLDYQHHGIGTASCGPDVFPEHELLLQEFNFNVRLTPFPKSYISPIALNKQKIQF